MRIAARTRPRSGRRPGINIPTSLGLLVSLRLVQPQLRKSPLVPLLRKGDFGIYQYVAETPPGFLTLSWVDI